MTQVTHAGAGYKYSIEPSINGASPSLLSRLASIAIYPFKVSQSIYNTCLLIWHGELRAPLANFCKASDWTSTFQTAFMTWHVVANPLGMKTALKAHRHDPENGLFRVSKSTREFQQIFYDAFPKAVQDDCLLFCHKNFVDAFRKPMLSALKPSEIHKNEKVLESILQNIGTMIAQKKNSVDLLEMSMLFTTTVISELVLGHPGPEAIYQKIAHAVDNVNRYAMRRAFHIKANAEEKSAYLDSVKTLRDAIDFVIEKNRNQVGSLVYHFSQSNFTTEQIQCNLLLMFMGGSETTAALLNYFIWQLGQHPDLQEEIYDDLDNLRNKYQNIFQQALNSRTIMRSFRESIRLFTPAYVEGREFAKDLSINVQDENGKTVFRKNVKKGEGFLLAPTFAARDARIFHEPDQYNPARFNHGFKKLAWLPFGDGIHSCPGQWLARSEVKLFIAWLVKNFKFSTSPGEIHQTGFATLKIKEQTGIQLQLR